MNTFTLQQIDIDLLIQKDEHVKAWRWYMFSVHHITVDRNGWWYDNRGNRLNKRSW